MGGKIPRLCFENFLVQPSTKQHPAATPKPAIQHDSPPPSWPLTAAPKLKIYERTIIIISDFMKLWLARSVTIHILYTFIVYAIKMFTVA